MSRDDDDIVQAAADLVGRTGATELQVGYLHDDVPAEQAGWYAHARYKGARITAEDHRAPAQALQALAERILTGARCQHCGGLVALSGEGAVAWENPVMADGKPWTAEEAEQAGQCRWTREGPRWVRGCENAAPPAPAAVKLAGTLARIPGVPAAMVAKAREGYYHDFLSPLATPEMQLVADLRDLARAPATPRNSRPLLHALADQVIRGEFDASKEEADAWAGSPEGQEAMRMLSPGEPGA